MVETAEAAAEEAAPDIFPEVSRKAKHLRTEGLAALVAPEVEEPPERLGLCSSFTVLKRKSPLDG